MKEIIEKKYNDIEKLLKEVNPEKYFESGDLDEIGEVIELLKDLKPLIISIKEFEKMLREDIKAESETDTPEIKTNTSGTSKLIEYRKSLLNLKIAQKTVIGHIEKLSRSLVDTFPDEKQVADNLIKKIEDMDEELQDLIDDAMNKLEDETEPINANIRSKLAECQKFFESDPLVAHLDENPFDNSVNIKTTLSSALKRIEDSMTEAA